MFQCSYCNNYESMHKFNVQRHEKGKHQVISNSHAQSSRAPTTISVGPDCPKAPTTVSVPPLGSANQYGDGIEIANCLMDENSLKKMKKMNPSKFHFLQKMMRPPKKTLEKLTNSKISDGKQGETKKKAANQKRSDFYKTKRGQLMKNKYNDRANLKKDIINKVLNMECSSDLAEMEKESILNLLRRMK